MKLSVREQRTMSFTLVEEKGVFRRLYPLQASSCEDLNAFKCRKLMLKEFSDPWKQLPWKGFPEDQYTEVDTAVVQGILATSHVNKALRPFNSCPCSTSFEGKDARLRGWWKASETSYCVRQGWDTHREVLSDHLNREARILEMPES